jgi:hypothetical protein
VRRSIPCRFLQPRGDRAGRIGLDRREVDDEFSGARRHRQAVGAKYHGFHGGGIGQAHEDEAGGGGNLARRACWLRARLGQRGGFAGRPIPGRDVVAGVQQTLHHGKPHHPEPEIAEFFCVLFVHAASSRHCHFPFLRRRRKLVRQRRFTTDRHLAGRLQANAGGLPECLNHERFSASSFALAAAGTGGVEWA